MIIEVKKINSKVFKWAADCTDLSGTPLIGLGKTKFEALSDLYSNVSSQYLIFGLRENGKVTNIIK